MKKQAKSDVQAAEASAASAGIEQTLQAYETALNGSDTAAVLAVFAQDGVFMAPNSPSAVGAAAVDAAYKAIFRTIGFQTELTIEEVVPISSDWAFARTTSSGAVTLRATQQRIPDANHELFVFQRTEGTWKISRYSFATTLPMPN